MLFEGAGKQLGFRLISTRTFKNGNLVVRYEPT